MRKNWLIIGAFAVLTWFCWDMMFLYPLKLSLYYLYYVDIKNI